MMDFEFLNYIYFWNSVKDILIAIWLWLLILLIIIFIKRIVIARLEILSNKTGTQFNDNIITFLSNIPFYFLFILSIYFTIKILNINEKVQTIVDIILIFVIVIESIRILLKVIGFWLHKILVTSKVKSDITTYNLFMLLTKIWLYILGWLFLLSNFGVEITPLLTSLWIVWLAVWFALQKILADIFSSFSIYLDKPFKIWDYIEIWTDGWIVKKIWIKTTRITTLQWQELIISNAELTWARINNFWNMKKKRIVFSVWVVYETSSKKLRQIPIIIKGIINSFDNIELDRVYLKNFGDFSINYEIVYFINDPDNNDFTDIQQEINLQIFELFSKHKIKFAYPKMIIYAKKS